MENWTTQSMTINGDLSYSLEIGEINTKYVDIEIVAYSDKWSNFDILVEFRERDGEEWRSDMQVLFSTANSLDKNRFRDLVCSPEGSLNLIRWDYIKNNLKYGETPDIRIKILPQYRSFSTSNVSHLVSINSGINKSQFIDSSRKRKPISLNQSGEVISLNSDSIRVSETISSSVIYSYSGLSSPSFAIQTLNGNYFVADTGNNRVIELNESMSTVVTSISTSNPIFLDYSEDANVLLVTNSSGVIYEYTIDPYNLVWTSINSFSNLVSATYSNANNNRILATDLSDNTVYVINKLTNSITTSYSEFSNANGESDTFNSPHIAFELEYGDIIVVEKVGRTVTFNEFTSSSSSSIDSSSSSSLTSSSLSSSSSS